MRALGDNYLRDEMRRHKDAQTTKKQWQTFITEWQQYKDMLTGEADLKNKGGDIHQDVLEALTDEQKQQLLELRREAQMLASALGVPKTKEP